MNVWLTQGGRKQATTGRNVAIVNLGTNGQASSLQEGTREPPEPGARGFVPRQPWLAPPKKPLSRLITPALKDPVP